MAGPSNAGPGTGAARRARTRPRKSDDASAAAVPSPLLEDDMLIADLMDGTLMPTVGAAPAAPMSSQTNSILSLPPMHGAAQRWESLGAAQPKLRHARHSSLGGPEVSRMVDARARKRPPPPISPLAVAAPRLPDREPPAAPEVRIDVSSMARHSRRASREFDGDGVGSGGGGASGGKIPNYGAAESSNRNAQLYIYPKREDDEWSTGNSSHNGSTRGLPRGVRKQRSGRRRRGFHPGDDLGHAWNWRFPGAEDSLMPSMAWIYLPLIGWLIFATAFTVNSVEKFIVGFFVEPVWEVAKLRWGDSTGMVALCAVRATVLVLGFAVVYRFAPMHGPGSGIPEMKCVLTGVFMPNVLSGSTLGAKMVGLSLALSSGISVGRLGPFMHMSGIIASLVSKIPLFKALNENALFKLQALSAAMAAGVGATFGAPIGGAMLSIELMSSYYYVHWLPMSLFCSIMGYYLVALFTTPEQHAFFNPDIILSLHGQPVYGIFVYGSLGAVCGIIGYFLVRYTVAMKKAICHFFDIDRHPRRIVIMLACFAVLHTYITAVVGGVLVDPQKKGVEKMFGLPGDDHGYDWLNPILQVGGQNTWGSSFALFVIMTIKFLLTGISLVLPIPAGTFMPIFEIGAFLGRSYGEFLRGIPGLRWLDPRATAIVGAASLTSGTLHVTSIAVVMLELTREAVNVLPITISVVVSYAVSKSLCSDLFSELIKFRRLPYILGLRERYPKETREFYEGVAAVVAKSFMNKKFPYVTPRTTASEARKLLATETNPVIAFLNDDKERKLYGVIKRCALERELDEMRRRVSGVTCGAGSVSDATAISSSGYTVDDRNEPIAFLRDFEAKHGHPLVDMGAMQISVHTPFWKVITYFRMLSMNVIYVMTTNGSVAGIITKTLVVQQCYDLEKEAKAKKHQQQQAERQTRRAEAEAWVKYASSQRVSRKIARQMSQSNLHGMEAGRRSRNASLNLSGMR